MIVFSAITQSYTESSTAVTNRRKSQDTNNIEILCLTCLHLKKYIKCTRGYFWSNSVYDI